MLGFLNFVAGVGAALLLAAGWIRWRDRHPRATIAGAVLGMVGLFFCHLMGLLFGLVLIGAYELDRAWTQRSWRRVALAMLLLPAPALFYALSPLGHAAGAGVWLGLADKLRQLLFPFINYSLTLDTCTALAVAGFLLACAATGRLRAPRHVVLALAGLAALYAVSPYAFKDTQSLDTRFTVMIALLLFAGLCPVRVPRRVIAGFLLLFALRSAVLAAAWHGHAADLAQLRAVIGGIAPGTRVTVAWVSMAEAPDYWSRAPAARRLSNGIPTDTHLPALLMIEQHAFWPLLFDESTQQPVLLRPDYQRLADQAGGQTDHRALAARPPAQSGLCGYDALLLLDAGGEADLHGFAADRLELLAATDMAALFRVRTGQVCPAGG
jgi:hypothetical protein